MRNELYVENPQLYVENLNVSLLVIKKPLNTKQKISKDRGKSQH